MQNVKSSWDCMRMVCPRNFFAWRVRYVFRLPEKLICKLEPDWDAEAARSVKKSSGLYAYGRSRELFCVEREVCAQTARKFTSVNWSQAGMQRLRGM